VEDGVFRKGITPPDEKSFGMAKLIRRRGASGRRGASAITQDLRGVVNVAGVRRDLPNRLEPHPHGTGRKKYDAHKRLHARHNQQMEATGGRGLLHSNLTRPAFDCSKKSLICGKHSL
jgi:hypothetical protein